MTIRDLPKFVVVGAFLYTGVVVVLGYLNGALDPFFPNREERQVLVAKEGYEQGTVIKDPESMFEPMVTIAQNVPSGSIPPSRLADLRDRTLLRRLEKEGIVTSQDVDMGVPPDPR
jgi:hypothetical protein